MLSVNFLVNLEKDLTVNKDYQRFLDWAISKGAITNNRLSSSRTRIGKQAIRYMKLLTPFLSGDDSRTLRYNVIKHNLNGDTYFCPACNKPRPYNTTTCKFRITCGIKDNDHKLANNKEISSRIKTTTLERYGVEYGMRDPVIMQRQKDTVFEKYGVDNVFTNKDIQKKIHATNVSKFGFTVASKNEHIKIKAAETCIKRYGVKSPTQNSVIISKVVETNIKVFGVSSARQKHFNLHNFSMLSKEFIEKKFIKNGLFLIKDFQQFLGCSPSSARRYLKKFEVDYDKNVLGGFNPQLKAILYYFLDILTGLYKIGITNGDINSRFGKRFSNKRIQILKIENFDVGQDAYDKEQYILEKFSELRILNNRWPEEKGGKTEFFTEDILQLNIKELE